MNVNMPLSSNDMVRKIYCYRILDFSKADWVEKLGEQNEWTANAQVLTNALSIPVWKKWTLNLHHQIVGDAQINAPKTLFDVFYHGNDKYIGKTAVMDNSLNASVRSELGLGAAYQYKNFSIAGRLKSQNGIAAAFTNRNELRLTTDSNYYSLNLSNDYSLLTFQPNENERTNPLSLLNDNGGYSFDLGVTMKWKKFDFAASFLDIGGKLTWQRNPLQYRSQGNFTFDGLTGLRLAEGGVESVGDSIKSVLNFKTENERVRYTQKLPMRTYLSARYQLKEKISVGALVYVESRETRRSFAATAYVGYTPKAWLNLGATVGYRNGTLNNVGVQATTTVLKRLQVYLITDNAWSVANMAYAKNLNVRVGMNLILGKQKTIEEMTKKEIEQKYGAPKPKETLNDKTEKKEKAKN
jgi:hypothetical protein